MSFFHRIGCAAYTRWSQLFQQCILGTLLSIIAGARQMASRMKTFRLMGRAKQWMLVTIWLRLLKARIALVWPGFSYFTAGLVRQDIPPRQAKLSPSQLAQTQELSELVTIAARYTPRQSNCLTQVLVLQKLLAQRQIPGCFCLGVRRADSDDEQPIRAHAWLQCGNTIVNGVKPGRSYSTLSAFSWGMPA
jgi:Transglutaminase-like superfamily